MKISPISVNNITPKILHKTSKITNPIKSKVPLIISSVASSVIAASTLVRPKTKTEKLQDLGIDKNTTNKMLSLTNNGEKVFDKKAINVLSVLKNDFQEYFDYILETPENIRKLDINKEYCYGNPETVYSIDTDDANITFNKNEKGKIRKLNVTYYYDDSKLEIKDILRCNGVIERNISKYSLSGCENLFPLREVPNHSNITPKTNKIIKDFEDDIVQKNVEKNNEIKKSISPIIDKMLENGFEKTKKGFYRKNFSKNEIKNLESRFGEYSDDLLNLYERPFSLNKIEKFGKFLSLYKDKTSNLSSDKFSKIFESFLILDKHCSLSFLQRKCENNKDYFSLLNNYIEKNMNFPILQSFKAYKSSYFTAINGALRSDLVKPTEVVKSYIYNLSNYIETQKIPKGIKLYRGEGDERLEIAKLSNGKNINLSEMFFDAIESKVRKKISEVKEFILDNEITVKQPSFMSVSLNKEIADRFAQDIYGGKRIVWEFETEENTKGAYIEGFNVMGCHNREQEVLLQKDSVFKIEDFEYDNEDNILYLKAKVSN